MRGTCSACGEGVVEAGAAFCESCGAPLEVTAAADVPPVPASSSDDLGSGPISAPTHLTPGHAAGATEPAGPRPCLTCGGVVGPDGYCEQCGTKAPSERDHFRQAPAAWVAGVCDRGIVHSRNEDAMALLASPTSGERAVLVVLDGVSNTLDSHIASLAGARAALDVLRTPLPRGMGTPASAAAAVAKVWGNVVRTANAAVCAATDPTAPQPASATFTAAVVENNRVEHANVGDSRSYWIPDGSAAVQLSVDDSASQMHMAAGMSRVEAENAPDAHAITKWLGPDAPDLVPTTGSFDVVEPGWLVVCSDGFWNYASEPEEVRAQITAAGSSDPAVLALALTAFANACGGRDNITVALARIDHAAAPTERESDG